jgi:3-hydroxyisobutyrate dehydrogenase-like beta-hydroxyacid dehydrogenase
MADDPNKQDGRDRSKVAGEQDYEVQHFAQANGITPDQTRELIGKHGNDRETLEREAKKMRA